MGYSIASKSSDLGTKRAGARWIIRSYDHAYRTCRSNLGLGQCFCLYDKYTIFKHKHAGAYQQWHIEVAKINAKHIPSQIITVDVGNLAR